MEKNTSQSCKNSDLSEIIKEICSHLIKEKIFEKHKKHLDLSSIQLDGSQSLAKRGGESVGYELRRKGITSNMLFFCDNNGIPLSCSEVIPGNHHDVYDIENQLDSYSLKTYFLTFNIIYA